MAERGVRDGSLLREPLLCEPVLYGSFVDGAFLSFVVTVLIRLVDARSRPLFDVFR